MMMRHDSHEALSANKASRTQLHLNKRLIFACYTATPPRHSVHHTVHYGHDTRAQVQWILRESTCSHDYDHQRGMPSPSSPYIPRNTDGNCCKQVLGGIADTVAQTLTALRMRRLQRQLNPDADRKDDFFSIEIGELDKKVPWPEEDFMLPPSKRGPPPFDFERLTRFMAYGFLWAPIQHKWFSFLEHTFPLVSGKATGSALRRVAMDQLIFAPIGKDRPIFHG